MSERSGDTTWQLSSMGDPTVDVLLEVRQLWDSPTSETLLQDVKGISNDLTLTLDDAKRGEDHLTAPPSFAIFTLALLQGSKVITATYIQLQVYRVLCATWKLTSANFGQSERATEPLIPLTYWPVVSTWLPPSWRPWNDNQQKVECLWSRAKQESLKGQMYTSLAQLKHRALYHY